MDKDTIEKIKAAVDLGGNVAGMFLPGQAAYIALGKAVAVVAPEIYASAVALFEAKEPTPEDKHSLAQDIHALLNPESA